MEIRVALALCVVLFSALCGKSLADGVRRRANSLRALAEGLRRLRIHMTSMFEPVQNALDHADCPLMAMVAEGMRGGLSAKAAWEEIEKKAARRGGPIDSLTEADRKVLARLFAGLGQSGREEQDLLLGSALQAIESLREGAQEKVGEADRLYATLGLLIGLMLALIVI
ncbi:MAG: stage III sporulation protein AB [Clostridia bacterium]|nr:stage III sporulation protein AB [Clostridia bacterium]